MAFCPCGGRDVRYSGKKAQLGKQVERPKPKPVLKALLAEAGNVGEDYLCTAKVSEYEPLDGNPVLGDGAFAVVYGCRHIRTGECCALRQLECRTMRDYDRASKELVGSTKILQNLCALKERNALGGIAMALLHAVHEQEKEEGEQKETSEGLTDPVSLAQSRARRAPKVPLPTSTEEDRMLRDSSTRSVGTSSKAVSSSVPLSLTGGETEAALVLPKPPSMLDRFRRFLFGPRYEVTLAAEHTGALKNGGLVQTERDTNPAHGTEGKTVVKIPYAWLQTRSAADRVCVVVLALLAGQMQAGVDQHTSTSALESGPPLSGRLDSQLSPKANRQKSQLQQFQQLEWRGSVGTTERQRAARLFPGKVCPTYVRACQQALAALVVTKPQDVLAIVRAYYCDAPRKTIVSVFELGLESFGAVCTRIQRMHGSAAGHYAQFLTRTAVHSTCKLAKLYKVALACGREVLMACAYLHAMDCVSYDIKPDNFVLFPDMSGNRRTNVRLLGKLATNTVTKGDGGSENKTSRSFGFSRKSGQSEGSQGMSFGLSVGERPSNAPSALERSQEKSMQSGATSGLKASEIMRNLRKLSNSVTQNSRAGLRAEGGTRGVEARMNAKTLNALMRFVAQQQTGPKPVAVSSKVDSTKSSVKKSFGVTRKLPQKSYLAVKRKHFLRKVQQRWGLGKKRTAADKKLDNTPINGALKMIDLDGICRRGSRIFRHNLVVTPSFVSPELALILLLPDNPYKPLVIKHDALLPDIMNAHGGLIRAEARTCGMLLSRFFDVKEHIEDKARAEAAGWPVLAPEARAKFRSAEESKSERKVSEADEDGVAEEQPIQPPTKSNKNKSAKRAMEMPDAPSSGVSNAAIERERSAAARAKDVALGFGGFDHSRVQKEIKSSGQSQGSHKAKAKVSATLQVMQQMEESLQQPGRRVEPSHQSRPPFLPLPARRCAAQSSDSAAPVLSAPPSDVPELWNRRWSLEPPAREEPSHGAPLKARLKAKRDKQDPKAPKERTGQKTQYQSFRADASHEAPAVGHTLQRVFLSRTPLEEFFRNAQSQGITQPDMLMDIVFGMISRKDSYEGVRNWPLPLSQAALQVALHSGLEQHELPPYLAEEDYDDTAAQPSTAKLWAELARHIAAWRRGDAPGLIDAGEHDAANAKGVDMALAADDFEMGGAGGWGCLGGGNGDKDKYVSEEELIINVEKMNAVSCGLCLFDSAERLTTCEALALWPEPATSVDLSFLY